MINLDDKSFIIAAELEKILEEKNAEALVYSRTKSQVEELLKNELRTCYNNDYR